MLGVLKRKMAFGHRRKTTSTNNTRVGEHSLTPHSPIQQIDDDVLSTIFLETLNAHRPGDLNMSRTYPGVVISHVCRHWREVALTTKLLWRYWSIIFGHTGTGRPAQLPQRERREAWRKTLKRLQEATRVWMSRSGDCPITLLVDDIRTPEWAPPQGCPELASLMDLICQTSSRWESVEFRLHFQSISFPTDHLLSVPPQTNPKLTSVTLLLEFVSCRNHPVRQKLVSSPNILNTPSIRSLKIGREVMIHHIMDIPTNWRNLRELDVGRYSKESPHILSAPQALQLFKACPSLVKCTLDIQGDGRPIPMHPETITLPLLEDLSLSPEAWHLPYSFASSLNLPSLVKLRVCDGNQDRYYQWHPRETQESGLCEFFEQFGSTLQDVTFSYAPLSPSALLHCLHHLPNITSLTLTNLGHWNFLYTGAQITRSLLDSLTPRLDGPSHSWMSLCPKIEEFNLRLGPDIFIEDETAILDFIEAKRRVIALANGSSIVRLRQVNCNGYDFYSINPVKDLRSRGVDLVGFSFNYYSE